MPGGKATDGNSYSSGVALRMYDGKQQKGCFTEVKSFRDMSIAIEQEVIKSQTEAFYKDTPEGKREVQVDMSKREWINPDKPGVSIPFPQPGAAARLGAGVGVSGFTQEFIKE